MTWWKDVINDFRKLDALREENARLSARKEAMERLLSDLLNEKQTIAENLTRCQERSTQLLVENRRLRNVPDDLTCTTCKRTEKLPPVRGEFNEQLAFYRGWQKSTNGWVCTNCCDDVR